jgi:hypothetical protein
MLPKTHIFFGLIFSSILFLIFPQIGILGFLIIWLSSFLIDVDHYLFYVYLKKDLSLKNAHKWFMKKHITFHSLSKEEKKQKLKNVYLPCIFHGIEAIVILVLLYFFFPIYNHIFLYILIGFLFHQFLDFISIIFGGYTLRHLGSQSYNLIKFKQSLKSYSFNY